MKGRRSCFHLMLFGVVILYLTGTIKGGVISNSVHDAPAPKVNSPELGDVYSVQGTLYIPYAEIAEPFYAWVNRRKNASRIDYYGGMVKTYQLRSVGQYGASFMVAPMTTENVKNQKNCFQVKGMNGSVIQVQSVLPDLSGFKLIGDDVILGQKCQKWQSVVTNWKKINKYTMWLKNETSPVDPFLKIAIPVRYEMKGYNSLLGSHYDHYYLDYYSFSLEPPKDEVFKVDSTLKCHDFPGPGEEHVYSFNPMMEFIHNYEDHVNTQFNHFKKTHNKNYTDHHEHEHRKDIFRQNMRFISSKNRAGLSYRLAMNHLGDKTDEELKHLHGRRHSKEYNGGKTFSYTPKDLKTIPNTMDWRLYGAVTPVKDQSVCGSCWSFGTVGTVEGALFLKTNQLTRLSQQALIDCSWGFGNNGCDGGEDFRSYQWMMRHGGIPTEDSYGPYLGADGYCHTDTASIVAPIKSYVNVTSADLNALKVAIAKKGPISVGIDASQKTFSFYANGVYYDPKCGNNTYQLDHAVLAVGYGVLYNQSYWLVKNSWSTYWGNDGYVLISQKDNNCGVATSPTYVVL